MLRSHTRAYIEKYKEEHPCVDCGETDIRVLQFDHRDPSNKLAKVNDLAKNKGIQAVIDEIKKCDVRCANCHQKKHYEERNK